MLTPAQAAFLAGLPQRPTGFNPYRNPTRRCARQRPCCGGWQASGALTPEQSREARRRAAGLHASAAAVRRAAFRRDGARICRDDTRPTAIETTLDAGLQATSTASSAASGPQLDRHGAANVAVVVLDNARGEWLAWEGSGDYFDAAHGGAIDGAVVAAAAGIGAEAVHVRARRSRKA